MMKLFFGEGIDPALRVGGNGWRIRRGRRGWRFGFGFGFGRLGSKKVRRSGVEKRMGLDKGGKGLMIGGRSGWFLVVLGRRRGRDMDNG